MLRFLGEDHHGPRRIAEDDMTRTMLQFLPNATRELIPLQSTTFILLLLSKCSLVVLFCSFCILQIVRRTTFTTAKQARARKRCGSTLPARDPACIFCYRAFPLRFFEQNAPSRKHFQRLSFFPTRDTTPITTRIQFTPRWTRFSTRCSLSSSRHYARLCAPSFHS